MREAEWEACREREQALLARLRETEQRIEDYLNDDSEEHVQLASRLEAVTVRLRETERERDEAVELLVKFMAKAWARAFIATGGPTVT